VNPLETLQRIAEVEFASIVAQTDLLGVKAAPFAPSLEQGFRDFMTFVRQNLGA